ncbi:MAG: hypothetical protein KIT79_11480 [Deltaproteobacteria bacterium]|nr:hypothetical protein [Deltaproteobacteria bacterium]
MTRIVLLQTDLAIDRPGVDLVRCSLAAADKDSLLREFADGGLFLCDMNLLREDSYKTLIDLRNDIDAAVRKGAGLVCLTTRPSIRTSGGNKNVYQWIPALGERLGVQDDLVTKVVAGSDGGGPVLADPVLTTLFSTCAFDAKTLDGCTPFLVSEDQTPVGIHCPVGNGFVTLLPQSEDKKNLLVAVVDWALAHPSAGITSAGAAEPPSGTELETETVADASDALDLGALETGNVEAPSGETATEAVADGADAGDLDVMDLGTAEAGPSLGSPSAEFDVSPEDPVLDAASALASEEADGDRPGNIPDDDPFARRLAAESPAAAMPPATASQAEKTPGPPAPASPLDGLDESGEFDKTFNLSESDPFGSDVLDGAAPDADSSGIEADTAVVPDPAADATVFASRDTPKPVSQPPADADPEPLMEAASDEGGHPPWLDALHGTLPGLGEILERQAGIRDEISRLEEEYSTLQGRRSKADSWTPLVAGSPESFHRAVRNFFTTILSSSTEITGQGLILADAGIGKFLVLAVTKTGTVKSDAGRLLLHALADADVQTKGVIVVNQERDKSALERSPIDTGLADLAKARGFVVLPSILLYRAAVQHALDNDPPNAIDIIQLIHSGSGLITILR